MDAAVEFMVKLMLLVLTTGAVIVIVGAGVALAVECLAQIRRGKEEEDRRAKIRAELARQDQ